jgi:hypothetical protein
MNELKELRAHITALEAQLGRMRARGEGQLRAEHARHMSALTWNAIYGAPVPGSSRTVAEAAAAAQLAAAGQVWRAPTGGPEVAYGPEEERQWR